MRGGITSVLVVISVAGGVADARPARQKPAAGSADARRKAAPAAATPAAAATADVVADAPQCLRDPRGREAAEQARTAEALKDEPGAQAAWRAIAETFTVVARDPAVALDVRRDCAYAVTTALRLGFRTAPRAHGPWDNLVDDAKRPPPSIDRDEQRFLDAIATFLDLAPGELSDRSASLRFLRGNLRRRHEQLDVAHDDFAFVATHHRESEVGLYAVDLLLDGLILQKRYDEMIVWVWRLRADDDLMARNEDLAARLRLIEHRWWQLGADRAGTRPPTDADILVLHLAALPLSLLPDIAGLFSRILRPDPAR